MAPLPGLTPSPLGAIPRTYVHDQVANEIDSLREQRPGMVERVSQVTLMYDMLVHEFWKRAQQ